MTKQTKNQGIVVQTGNRKTVQTRIFKIRMKDVKQAAKWYGGTRTELQNKQDAHHDTHAGEVT